MLITKIYQPNEIATAARELQLGELIAFPTETVYGLGAVATNEPAVKRVYAAKGRPSDNPLIVTVSSFEMAKEYISQIPPMAEKLVEQFWPGSLTLIFEAKEGALPRAVTGGLKTAAFRMPDNQVTCDLISQVGLPLVGPSANSSGKPSPTTAQHVFHDLEGRIAGVVDDGACQVGVESTILDLTTTVPTILRPGAVTLEQLEAVLGTVHSEKKKVAKNITPKAPGMKYKHYAPNAQVLIVAEEQWADALNWAKHQTGRVGIMADPTLVPAFDQTSELFFDLGADIATASQRLFDGLRYFDSHTTPVEYILAQGYPSDGLGDAYMNRLKKSAGDTFFKAES